MEGVDPGHEYAVPFYWGTNTFAINTERVKKALGTDQLAGQSMGFGCLTPNTRPNSSNAASAIWTAQRRFILWY